MSIADLSKISVQFAIYAGYPVFVLGIIGNSLNLRLLYPSRSNPSSFLLLTSSIFNLLVLAQGFLPRILAISNVTDASSTNLFWCKSRLFITYTFVVGSLTCLCFASVDRYLVSSRNARWRNFSTLRMAQISLSIAMIVIMGSNVPLLVDFEIIEIRTATSNISTVCAIVSSGLNVYITYFIRPVLLTILPAIILSLTGWLTYQNATSMTQLQRRSSFQRTLTTMILVQIIAVIIPMIPFATITVYQMITSSTVKTPYRLAIEGFIFNISNIILFISYASNFYVYMISAASYRRDFKRFCRDCLTKTCRNNRVDTFSIQNGSKSVKQRTVQQSTTGNTRL